MVLFYFILSLKSKNNILGEENKESFGIFFFGVCGGKGHGTEPQPGSGSRI
jgi:hypothetical protein